MKTKTFISHCRKLQIYSLIVNPNKPMMTFDLDYLVFCYSAIVMITGKLVLPHFHSDCRVSLCLYYV